MKIEDSLLADETIVFRAGVHWIIFAMPAFLLVLALGCAFLPGFFSVISLVFLLSALAVGIPALITYTCTEFVVTTKRVIAQRGLFTRSFFGLMLAKVESVLVIQTIFGKLFNFGNINIIGTGSTQDIFVLINDPFAFRQAVLEGVNRNTPVH